MQMPTNKAVVPTAQSSMGFSTGENKRLGIDDSRLSLGPKEMTMTALDVWAEKVTSSKGNEVTWGFCEYVVQNTTTIQTYKKPLFTASGKILARDISPGKRYVITTKMSEYGNDEWIAARPITDKTGQSPYMSSVDSRANNCVDDNRIEVEEHHEDLSGSGFDDF
jgi:hypothetical protein